MLAQKKRAGNPLQGVGGTRQLQFFGDLAMVDVIDGSGTRYEAQLRRSDEHTRQGRGGRCGIPKKRLVAPVCADRLQREAVTQVPIEGHAMTGEFLLVEGPVGRIRNIGNARRLDRPHGVREGRRRQVAVEIIGREQLIENLRRFHLSPVEGVFGFEAISRLPQRVESRTGVLQPAKIVLPWRGILLPSVVVAGDEVDFGGNARNAR